MSRLKGTTAKSTSVPTLWMAPFTSVAHGNDGIERHVEEFGKLGDEEVSIEGASEHGHHQRANGQTHERHFFALVEMVEDGGGQHHGAAHGEVGEVAHKGGGGALEQQLDNNLQEFAHHAGHGAER